ncbi:MAG: sugar ABC transporter permease, partial [Lachnospiraceae bacterium]|nr:sugar ABC transporter permease [Lachnospiraceae bacterium]
MKNKKKFSGNYFKEFGTAVTKGDMGVKLSLLVMGAGYIAKKQIINGLIMIALEIVFILTCVFYAAPNLAKFGTLGTVQFEQVFDPLTMTSKVNDYDNSFLILLNSIIALFIIATFILVYIGNIKAVYRLQLRKEEGKHINTFREDIRALFNEKFHITLLTLPCLGIILMNIIPILVLVAVAFTNYDQQHMPPSALFTWVGWRNFKQLFTNSTTLTFGYSFGKILIWTLEWALLATLTTFIGGILMAQFINN